MLTFGYFVVWLLGPVGLADANPWQGLPLWFWCSCVAAPLLLCAAVAFWLRAKND